MRTMKQLKALLVAVPFVLLLGACGGSSTTTAVTETQTDSTVTTQTDDKTVTQTTETETQNEETPVDTSNIVVYATGDEVTIKAGDTYRALTDDTQVKMITDVESDETTIHVLSGQMEVTFN